MDARLTLPELNRRLAAEPLHALVVVPASFDPTETERHFEAAKWATGLMAYENGSTLRIIRGRPDPRHLVGYHLDLAVVLAPLDDDTLDKIRRRLLPRNGSLFAPFARETP